MKNIESCLQNKKYFVFYSCLFLLFNLFSFYIIFQLFCLVDAVYAMAHAIHQNLKERCGDIDFINCDSWKPAPVGTDLLRLIREVSFVGMQGNQVTIEYFMPMFILLYLCIIKLSNVT